jgi:hypothetical protein
VRLSQFYLGLSRVSNLGELLIVGLKVFSGCGLLTHPVFPSPFALLIGFSLHEQAIQMDSWDLLMVNLSTI